MGCVVLESTGTDGGLLAFSQIFILSILECGHATPYHVSRKTMVTAMMMAAVAAARSVARAGPGARCGGHPASPSIASDPTGDLGHDIVLTRLTLGQPEPPRSGCTEQSQKQKVRHRFTSQACGIIGRLFSSHLTEGKERRIHCGRSE